ncbi:HTH_38 domain-containing protein [Trichonephila clavipes]|nr:HTH_38 domain-containing protein [Trichonephila clavipes]
MSRRKQQPAFDQVSEYDRGRIAAYRDWGLSFKEIGKPRSDTYTTRLPWPPVTSGTVAQHIESVTHHSVSARTIRRRLQQSGLSARRPLLDLPLTQNHRRLRPNSAIKEGCGWQNGMKLPLLTSHTSVCNTTMVGFESGDTVERGW